MKYQLYDKLINLKAHRDEREQLSTIILSNTGLFPELLRIGLRQDDKTSVKAFWIIELVVTENAGLILPFSDKFISSLKQLRFEPSIRAAAKICQLMLEKYFEDKDPIFLSALTEAHFKQITGVCFDWLLNDHKVAAKAYAMQSLFLLGNRYEWIFPELKEILEKDFKHHSAAYKARARHILKKLS